MTLKEILNHNREILAEAEIHRLAIERLMGKIKAPCEFCPYEGVYRCDACQGDNYAGFNRPGYPNDVEDRQEWKEG